MKKQYSHITKRKTVLITGASSGIGRACALFFQEKGYNVAATMRNPQKELILNKLPNIICPSLDVLDENSIEGAITETIKHFGSIDILINNAGFALMGSFENTSLEDIKKQYDTNLLGVINTIQHILPHFRDQKSGTIINIASCAGKCSFPYLSFYSSSKFALEGLSESLSYELSPLNIKIRLIEPGAVQSNFYTTSKIQSNQHLTDIYAKDEEKSLNNLMNLGKHGSKPETLVKVIYKASKGKSQKLRYPTGIDGKTIIFLRKIFPDFIFRRIIKIIYFR